MEEINYNILIPFFLLAILLLAYPIRRNIRDKKKVEKDIIESEIKPPLHGKSSENL